MVTPASAHVLKSWVDVITTIYTSCSSTDDSLNTVKTRASGVGFCFPGAPPKVEITIPLSAFLVLLIQCWDRSVASLPLETWLEPNLVIWDQLQRHQSLRSLCVQPRVAWRLHHYWDGNSCWMTDILHPTSNQVKSPSWKRFRVIDTGLENSTWMMILSPVEYSPGWLMAADYQSCCMS